MSGSIIIKKLATTGSLSLPGNRAQRPRIPGAFPATQFGEQVISTGIPSLDGYVAGGILLGSVVLIKDEYPSRYADLVLKTFLAEGATYNHHLFVAAGQIDSTKFADELPSLKKEKGVERAIKSDVCSNSSELDKAHDMKIAWRYKEAAPLPVTLSSRGVIVKGQKQAKFEFTKKSTVQALGGHHLHLSKLEPDQDLNPPSFQYLLREIGEQAKLFDLTETGGGNNLLRIGISHCETQVLNPTFMLGLRAIVQSTNSCAVVTLSSLADPKLLGQVEAMADMVIQLEGILDEKKKDELGGVDGLCKIQKISSLNSIKLFVPPVDLGFTFRHKRITFQELHLPPEGETTAQRETVHKAHSHLHPAPESSCGGSKGSSIDF